MVCIPCIVVPFLLWFFHKYIQPYVQKFWPWSKQEKVEDKKTEDSKVGSLSLCLVSMFLRMKPKVPFALMVTF